VAGTGCATGGSQFQNTVYDTHRRVANLDKNLEASISKLTETTAELSTRAGDTDQQNREIKMMIEDVQNKLAALDKQVTSLGNKLLRAGGYSTGAPAGTSEVGSAGEVKVTPPASAPATATPPASTPPPPPAARTESAPAEPAAMESVATEPAAAQPAAAPAATSGDPEADYKVAQDLFTGHDYPKAQQAFDAYLQRHPNTKDSPNAQFWKAKSLQSMQKYEEAIGEYEKVRTNYTTSNKVPYAMHQQAVCHARLGQNERAVKLLQEVVKNYPTTPPAEQAKSDLQKLQGASEKKSNQ